MDTSQPKRSSFYIKKNSRTSALSANSQFSNRNFLYTTHYTFVSHKMLYFPILKDFYNIRFYFCLHLHFILRILMNKKKYIKCTDRCLCFTESKRIMCVIPSEQLFVCSKGKQKLSSLYFENALNTFTT